MTRRTVLLSLTALVLAGGALSPALASAHADSPRGTTCLLLLPKSGEREGICVWLPTATDDAR